MTPDEVKIKLLKGLAHADEWHRGLTCGMLEAYRDAGTITPAQHCTLYDWLQVEQRARIPRPDDETKLLEPVQ